MSCQKLKNWFLHSLRVFGGTEGPAVEVQPKTRSEQGAHRRSAAEDPEHRWYVDSNGFFTFSPFGMMSIRLHLERMPPISWEMFQPAPEITTEHLQTSVYIRPQSMCKCFYAPPSSPSLRLLQIRRRKKSTCDDMFSELMQSSCTDRVQLNAWRHSVAESRKALSECDEKRHDVMLRLMGEQMDMLRHLVELQESQQEHRPPLHPLYNCLPSSTVPISSTLSHSTPEDGPSNRRLSLKQIDL
ncbi:hypothetical protein UY3_02094 [Chelonia mydas]|uniref:Uncharacterized protein n=1 Tax=Chelonia mydas TaxID=8469 RepID=M7BU01_CHEMY|nr:hypothetical protein UY3_02094 [Chelonia mydas]